MTERGKQTNVVLTPPCICRICVCVSLFQHRDSISHISLQIKCLSNLFLQNKAIRLDHLSSNICIERQLLVPVVYVSIIIKASCTVREFIFTNSHGIQSAMVLREIAIRKVVYLTILQYVSSATEVKSNQPGVHARICYV